MKPIRFDPVSLTQNQRFYIFMPPVAGLRGPISVLIVEAAGRPLQLNCVSSLSYNIQREETENSLNSHLYWFILYCLRFMNYCKSDGVSHDIATGFLNQADRLFIERWWKRQRSIEESTIPDPGGENITPHSRVVVRSCSTRTTFPHNRHGALNHSYQCNSIGPTVMKSWATNCRSVPPA